MLFFCDISAVLLAKITIDQGPKISGLRKILEMSWNSVLKS